MAGSSFGVTTNNSYIGGAVNWNSTANWDGNYSDVYAELRISRWNTGYTTNGTGTWYLTINGTTIPMTRSVSISYNSNTLIIWGTVRVYHNDDGSKQINIGVSGGIPGTSYTATYGSGTATLDTIPRATTITTFNNFTIGDNIPVVLATKYAGFVNSLYLMVGSTQVAYRTNVPDNYTLVLSSAEQDQLYSLTPNSVTLSVTLICKTFNGGSQIGGDQSKGATASVPASIVPTIGSVTATETAATVASKVGLFVQNLSQIKYDITGAAGAKSSTISSYQITVDGKIYSGASVTTGVLNKSGNITVTGQVTDSRGRITTKSITVNLLAYSMPSITAFSIARANSDGTLNPMGTYAKVTSAGSVSSLLNSTQRNSLTYTIYSRPRGTTTWVQQKQLKISGLTLSAADTLTAIYAATSSFDFRLDVTDEFNTTLSLTVLSTGQVTMSFGNNGVGVGKVWENGALDVSGDIYENGTKLTDKYGPYGYSVPTGMVVPWAGRGVPSSGWLQCNGQAVSRSQYPALFNTLCPLAGNPTITLASPGVFTINAHGFWPGEKLYLTTTGALPTGLTPNKIYWISPIDANTFSLCNSFDDAVVGTNRIATSGTQSGTHTAYFCQYGLGDGSTTFNVPNFQGKVLVHRDASQAEFKALGQTGGEKTHVLTSAENGPHSHGVGSNLPTNVIGARGTDLGAEFLGTAVFTTFRTNADGLGQAHNNLQPYSVIYHIIKT